MNKLRLELDQLDVETFATGTSAERIGTVDGNDGRTITVVCGTCEVSCNLTACPADTCYDTCGNGCGSDPTVWTDWCDTACTGQPGCPL